MPVKKTPAKKAKKTSAKKTSAKKTSAKKTSAKKTSAKKTSAKKTSAKKTSAKKTSAKKTSAKEQATKKPAKKTRQCWLMKSEPDAYGIEDLQREKTTGWDGIRNYQARNFMRDQMRVGDEVLFYHSNAKPPGVAGLARVSRLGLVDPSQFDPSSKYHDPRSDPDQPRWTMVEVAFVERFQEVLPLDWLKSQASLSDMLVVQRGQRLSIQPVEARHFDRVVRAARGR